MHTHGGVLNLHTEGFPASLLSSLLSSPSQFLSSFLLSLSLSSFSLSCSLHSLVFSLFSLSNNVNDHSSSALSLGTHGSNLPECQSACAIGSIPCLANMFTLYARNNCPGFTVQASCHLE